MIIILKSGVTDAQIKHVIERVESLGLRAHLSCGTHRTIIGVIGDKSQLQPARFQAIPGVADVISVLPSYKLASLDAARRTSAIVHRPSSDGHSTEPARPDRWNAARAAVWLVPWGTGTVGVATASSRTVDDIVAEATTRSERWRISSARVVWMALICACRL